MLAVAWLYPGFDIEDGSSSVFAMDEDVIELVNARCVPMRLTNETRAPFVAQERYGLSETAFGCGLLLVSPEGEVLADSPFLQPPVAYDFLCRELALRPELVHMDRVVDQAPASFPPYDVYPLKPEWTPPSGSLSSPKNATKAKGDILLEVCTHGIVEALRREFAGG